MDLHCQISGASSDDGEGTGTWKVVAGVRAVEVAAVLAEADADLSAVSGPTARSARGTGRNGDWTILTPTLTGPWDWGRALVAG